MDEDPVALLLKFGFLAVLYLFLILVARSASRDVAGGAEEAYADAGGVARPGRRRRRAEPEASGPSGLPRLEVVAAMGHDPGTEFEVGEGLTLGRASTADITVEDSFASSTHAHVYLRGGHIYVEDAGSTNGTYLNGRPLRRPERLSVADTVRIGETEYRYQE